MAYSLAIILVVNLALLIVMQTIYVVIYYRFLTSSRLNFDRADSATKKQEANDHSRVAVVLCLRGADPSLRDCIGGLANQSYKEFELHIVVDSKTDPSLEIVNDLKQTQLKPIVHVLSEHPPHRSLKCSALLKAIESISGQVDTIAFLDADTIPDPDWLADLIRPLAHPKIGATTGSRWFQPHDPTLGSMLRQVWNGAAVVQMAIYDIAWGGSFAIKRSTLQSTNILDRWSKSFCEDTLLTDELERNGLRLFRVPQLICLNTESTTVASMVPWISRQLLTTRLYHRRWPLVQLHALSIFFGSYVAMAAAIALTAIGDWRSALLILGAVVAFFVVSLVLQRIVEQSSTRIVGRRYGRSAQVERRAPFKILVAVILAQFIQPWACLRATFQKNVGWRGIQYRIGPGRQIEMVEYRPIKGADSAPLENKRESIE